MVNWVAIAGTESGKKIRHRIVQRLAPSMIAASSRSLGMLLKNWRKKKVPAAVKIQGMIKDWNLSSQPNTCIIL